MARRKGVNDDLLEPFRKAAREAAGKLARGESVDIVVKGPLILDLEEASTAPITLGSLIVERIKTEVAGSAIPVSQATRERRHRSIRTPQGPSPGQGSLPRYPDGYTPNPQGPYGYDSGYLHDSLVLNIESGKADVFAGIPRNRQKAAFIMRRISPTAGSELPGAVHRTTSELIKTIVRKTIQKAVRKELRGTGITAKVR